MVFLETAIVVGLSTCLSGGAGVACAVPCMRFGQRIRIGWKRFVTGFWRNQIRLNTVESVVVAETSDVLYIGSLFPKLEEFDAELLRGDDADPSEWKKFKQWKSAYRWSRRAREKFNYPSLNSDNKIIVCDWLRRTMEGEHVRPGQIHSILPKAMVLSFVRSRAEREAVAFERVFAGVGDVMDVNSR